MQQASLISTCGRNAFFCHEIYTSVTNQAFEETSNPVNPKVNVSFGSVYAMPPMARVTKLSLMQVNNETVDFGRMAGCSAKQLTWKVMIPSIRPRLMVGVNQVIM